MKKLSKVITDKGGCPKCGAQAFKAKRSAVGKLAGGILAPKSRVQCIACGKEF